MCVANLVSAAPTTSTLHREQWPPPHTTYQPQSPVHHTTTYRPQSPRAPPRPTALLTSISGIISTMQFTTTFVSTRLLSSFEPDQRTLIKEPTGCYLIYLLQADRQTRSATICYRLIDPTKRQVPEVSMKCVPDASPYLEVSMRCVPWASYSLPRGVYPAPSPT